jgi:lysyl-tRNA synthetase class II
MQNTFNLMFRQLKIIQEFEEETNSLNVLPTKTPTQQDKKSIRRQRYIDHWQIKLALSVKVVF